MTNFGSSWALGALSKISAMPANMRPSEPSANGIAYFRAGANMVPRRGTIRQAHRLPVPISRGAAGTCGLPALQGGQGQAIYWRLPRPAETYKQSKSIDRCGLHGEFIRRGGKSNAGHVDRQKGADIAPNEINAFLAINPDGSILIRSPHNEMGQGAITALPMIVAEELECDWSKVKVEYASSARNLRDHNVYGDMVTAGSRGVRTTWQMLLQAGASARVRLIQAAARRWEETGAEREAGHRKGHHKRCGRSLDYGTLAAEAGKI